MPFRDVVGHRRILSLLAQSAARNSVPQSLVFAGPSGVGKHLIAIALATVFIVLGMLYESYIHPITILSTIPSAGAGALLAQHFPGGPDDHNELPDAIERG